jgi:hypothetical protein
MVVGVSALRGISRARRGGRWGESNLPPPIQCLFRSSPCVFEHSSQRRLTSSAEPSGQSGSWQRGNRIHYKARVLRLASWSDPCSALVMLGFSAIVRFQSAACSRRDSSQSLPSGHPAFIICLLYVLRVVPSNNAPSLDRSFGRFGRLLRPGVTADRSQLQSCLDCFVMISALPVRDRLFDLQLALPLDGSLGLHRLLCHLHGCRKL